MTPERIPEVLARLGARFEVRAVHVGVGERLDVKGLEPLTPQSPVMVEVASAGRAALLRSGAIVLFGVDPAGEERFLASLGPRIQERHAVVERERAVVRLGDADGVEPDALVLKEPSLDRLQLVAEVLGKSVILAHYEQTIADAFTSIEPLAVQMTLSPGRRPWKQKELTIHQEQSNPRRASSSRSADGDVK